MNRLAGIATDMQKKFNNYIKNSHLTANRFIKCFAFVFIDGATVTVVVFFILFQPRMNVKIKFSIAIIHRKKILP